MVSHFLLGLLLALPAAGVSHTKPTWIWGVTVDNVTDLSLILDSFKSLKVKPTVRVVFDPGASPKDYLAAVRSIHREAFVMGLPIDSAPPSGKLSVEAYRQRVAGYMDELGKSVDIWEIGNEVNGDWTCDSSEMGRKISAALEEAKRRRRPTALTLFYSDFYLGQDREMVAWSSKYLTEKVRRGLDYVLVSFYPDNADGKHPEWTRIFHELGQTFPRAKLGFGELGLRKADFSLSEDLTQKRALVDRYYRMPSPVKDRFIGGFFWWTYRQDALKKDVGLWSAFHDAIR